jgi:hypothetical protein
VNTISLVYPMEALVENTNAPITRLEVISLVEGQVGIPMSGYLTAGSPPTGRCSIQGIPIRLSTVQLNLDTTGFLANAKKVAAAKHTRAAKVSRNLAVWAYNAPSITVAADSRALDRQLEQTQETAMRTITSVLGETKDLLLTTAVNLGESVEHLLRRATVEEEKSTRSPEDEKAIRDKWFSWCTAVCALAKHR